MGKRNCWTCVHDYIDEYSGEHYCHVVDDRPDVQAWWEDVDNFSDMPPHSTKACPGWEAKERDDD